MISDALLARRPAAIGRDTWRAYTGQVELMMRAAMPLSAMQDATDPEMTSICLPGQRDNRDPMPRLPQYLDLPLPNIH